jgi:hypothetical protein
MEINTQKTQSIHEIGPVNLSKLIPKVEELGELDWDTNEDFSLNYNKSKTPNKGALNSTRHIIYRFTNKNVSPFEYIESNRWEKISSILLPILSQATSYLNYQNPYYPKVMLANLPSKNFIPPHIDGDKKGYIPHKIHIPLQTNEEAFFFLENEKFHFKKGVAYEVNNGKKHSVVNSGDNDRIHLVFECLDFDIQSDVIKKQIENRTKG